MNRLIALAVLTLAACSDPPGTVTPENGAGESRVLLLFTHDGCNVYRVYGTGPDYFVKCGVNGSVEYGKQEGKTRRRVRVETGGDCDPEVTK